MLLKCKERNLLIVVDNLITPVILGIDFLQKQQLTLNNYFSCTPVMMTKPAATVEAFSY